MKLAALTSAIILSHALSAPAADVATFIELPDRFVIGGHSAGNWLESEKAGKMIKPGTAYRLYTLKGAKGKATATKIAPEADVCMDVWMAEFDDVIDEDAIGVCAPWNPMPRPVKSADTKQDTYVKAVAEILTAKGIAKPVVKITQHLRVDLDGDGEEEALIGATRYSKTEEGSAPNAASAGNYSFVALRRVVNGKVETHIIEGEFYPKNMVFNAPNIYQVTGVLDMDGDGKMEVIVNSAYYEGGATTVWKLGKKKPEKVMEIACGV
jgi:hypothetical protein